MFYYCAPFCCVRTILKASTMVIEEYICRSESQHCDTLCSTANGKGKALHSLAPNADAHTHANVGANYNTRMRLMDTGWEVCLYAVYLCTYYIASVCTVVATPILMTGYERCILPVYVCSIFIVCAASYCRN